MRRVAVLLGVMLLVAGCTDSGDDGPGSCYGVTLWGDLSLTDSLVEVRWVVDTGREVTNAQGSATYPVSSGVVTRVFSSQRSLAGIVGEGEVLEFLGMVEVDGPVILFLLEPVEGAGLTKLGFRIAAVEEEDGLRFLGGRAACWADDFDEFVALVDWSLVERRQGAVERSDLQLMVAWVREIIEVDEPRENGPITLAWFGEDDHHLLAGCRSAPEDQRVMESPFGLTISPRRVSAGTTASLRIDPILPKDVAGWGGLWECWNGEKWIATHQIAHGRLSRPGAALPIEPGTLTTMPAIGIRIPETFTITIPYVPPGWYRLREHISSGGESAVGYLSVEVVRDS